MKQDRRERRGAGIRKIRRERERATVERSRRLGIREGDVAIRKDADC